MARRTLTLLGSDVLLVAMGERRPNNAVFVVECDGRIDPPRVSDAVRRFTELAPWIASRLERPFPWGRLRWTVETPLPPDTRPIVAVSDGDDASAVDACLNMVIDARREPPLRIRIVYGEDASRRPTTWLVVCWAHPLMDPRGAELLVAMLDALVRDDAGREWAHARLLVAPPDPRPFRERATIARRGVDLLHRLAEERARSLGREVAKPGRVRHHRTVVPAAPARPLHATLALVSAGVSELWRRRGLELDGRFVVPISVDRRRKGEPGPVFGNYLSFHFARVPPTEWDGVGATAAAVRQDLADAVREDLIETMWVAMNFGRYYPPSWLLRTGGAENASFNCADTGEIRPALPTLFGRPVRGGYHVPCVHPRPGLGVFFSRAGGSESVTAVWGDGVVETREARGIVDGLARAISAARAA
jgi:hypothetical protein